MKKNNLLKIILIMTGIVSVLTWIIPAAQFTGSSVEVGKTNPVGLWTIIRYTIEAFKGIAIPLIVLIAVVGGFYGILNETGVYKKLIDNVVDTFKKKKQLFLIITVISISLITSITGMPLMLFFIFPFIISILMEMKYDRLSIMAATVGSTLVGILGSTYSYSIAGSINSALKLDVQNEMITRIFLFAISLFLLIVYIINNQNKAQLNKEFNDPLYIESKNVKKKLWPMVTIFIVTGIIMILGVIDWSKEFKVNAFQDIYSSIMNFKVFSTPIISNIVGILPPFGVWGIIEASIFIFIITIIMVIVYRVKFDNAIETFAEGAKKVLPIALMIGAIYTILFISAYHPFYMAITDWMLGLTKSFNMITMVIVTIINSALLIDIQYLVQQIVPAIGTLITDTNAYSIVSIIIQSIYAITMLLVPTSVMLILGLMYLQIPYRTWIKYIYKLAIQLLVIVIIIITIMAMI